jgi:Fe-S oxidoreductase
MSCHGCRRCVSLCDSFPTLFDLIDESETLEVDGVAFDDYDKVVDQCYMCDLCYLTKCPYVPPHEFNVDFPHLMLRAKAQNFKTKGAKLRDKVLTSTDALMSGISMISTRRRYGECTQQQWAFRRALESTFDIAAEAPLPEIHRNTLIKRAKN